MMSVASPINPSVFKQTLCGEQMIKPMQRMPVRIINPVVPSCQYALEVGRPFTVLPSRSRR